MIRLINNVLHNKHPYYEQTEYYKLPILNLGNIGNIDSKLWSIDSNFRFIDRSIY